MTFDQFLSKLNTEPESIQFSDTMQLIDAHYNFSPCEFSNGDQINEANQNNGSCKLLAFAQLHKLSIDQTLECFGDYYRIDVLQHPGNDDHQNIRNFMVHGWEGVNFKGLPLTKKV
tara:strand:+ start:2186 stop:2533 length:348 start_codon:yes stop_codon:yes gene_type:complete